jgi:bla regulator protein BlaR1
MRWQRMTNKPSSGRTFLLAAIGVAIAVPLACGLVNTPQIRAQTETTSGASVPSFEVVSIKLNRSGDDKFRLGTAAGRFTTTGTTTKALIAWAFNVKNFQLTGGPGWINSEKYDIDAKIEDSLANELQKLTPDQRGDQIRLMVQSLLADRFKLKVNHATKELPVYALVVAKNGPKVTESQEYRGMMRMSARGQLTATGIPIRYLTDAISRELDRVVLDQTGLKGNYDFTLQWTPEIPTPAGAGDGSQGTPNTPLSNSSAPSLFTALQEQLGLRLESTKGPVQTLVIDHIEEPSAN